MVREAAGRQGGISADIAIQHLMTLLQQLAADLTSELIALGPAEAAKLKPAGLQSGARSAAAGGQAEGSASWRATPSQSAVSSAAGGLAEGGTSWRAMPSQSGVQLGGSKALQELQGVLAGGMEQGLAASGDAVKEVRLQHTHWSQVV